MKPNAKILILTASYGDGHKQVSNALQQMFRRIGIRHIRVVDLFEEAYPVMNKVAKYLIFRSMTMSEFGIPYYGWCYYRTRRLPSDGIAARWVNHLGMDKLMQIIRSENPDLLIYTFPYGRLNERIKASFVGLRTATVITDFAVHNMWLVSKPDHYFVATEDVKQELVRRGVPEHNITVSGIPIRASFRRRGEAAAVASASRASARSILVMAGACGTARSLKSLIRLLLLIPDTVIDVVCGRNLDAERKMREIWAAEPRVRVHGFTDRMPELMRQACCMVTKAGGVTLAEAIYAKVPIFILKPFPGQEKENARYLAEQGAACVADTIEALVSEIRLLCSSDQVRTRMVERLGAIRREAAWESIAGRLLRPRPGAGTTEETTCLAQGQQEAGSLSMPGHLFVR